MDEKRDRGVHPLLFRRGAVRLITEKRRPADGLLDSSGAFGVIDQRDAAMEPVKAPELAGGSAEGRSLWFAPGSKSGSSGCGFNTTCSPASRPCVTSTSSRVDFPNFNWRRSRESSCTTKHTS